MTDTQQQQAPGTSLEISPAGAPSAVRTVDDVAQVMVDQWGHRGEFYKNQIVHRGDLDAAAYDWEHAVRVGAIRPLTHAEARVWAASASPNSPLNPDGSLDLDHQAAMRIGAGIPLEQPQTITPAAGPAEPAEFSKSNNDLPPPRPIVESGTSPIVESGASATAGGGRPPAAELVAQARAASTNEQLDQIDAQADNRMTSVHEAVAQRRAELAGAPPEPLEPPKENDEG
jgi:hypothetical protein